jgi:uncharacterized membrane protein
MIHDLKGLIHTAAAVAAMVLGAVVFFRPKGGRVHRLLGYAYTLCMLLLIATSFMIYRLTGGFNFLHGASIASSMGVAFGFGHAFLRRPRDTWLVRHYFFMSWSYIGLLAAFVAEISTRVAMPYVARRFGGGSLLVFWCIVALASAAVVIAGARLVNRNRRLVSAPP